MARLIDADKIADYVCDKCGEDNCDRNPAHCIERDFIMACAKEMPEAVVRCKDCQFWNSFPTASATPYIHECGCRYPRRGTSANDFCSWAERKENEAN